MICLWLSSILPKQSLFGVPKEGFIDGGQIVSRVWADNGDVPKLSLFSLVEKEGLLFKGSAWGVKGVFLEVGPDVGHHLDVLARPIGLPHHLDHFGGSDAKVFPVEVMLFDDTFGFLEGGGRNQWGGTIVVTKQSEGIIVGGEVGDECIL